MKYLLLSVFFLGCMSPATPKCVPEDPNPLETDEARLDACTRAGKRLRELKCRDDRPDYVAKCRAILAGSPAKRPLIRPACYATIKACEEVDTVCL